MFSYFLLSIFATVNAYNVTLYSKDSRQGSSFDIVSDLCVTIPQWFVDLDNGVSGVWIQETSIGTSCVVLFTETDCDGYLLYMRPGTLYHANLQRVGFDDRAKSIGPCEMIKVERGSSVLVQTIMSWSFLLCCVITVINTKQSQKLDMEIYDSCVNIPDWFIAYDDGISGFHTHGSCVIAYSLTNCEGHHIIMKPGTLEHSRLNEIGFDNLAQSVGPCDIKRIEREDTIKTTNTVSKELVFFCKRKCFLSYALIICTCITLLNAGLYLRHLKRRKKEQKLRCLNRELPLVPISEGNNYQAFDSDNFGYERVVNDMISKSSVSIQMLYQIDEMRATTLPNSLRSCIEREIDQIFNLMLREPAKIRVYELELSVNLSETKLSSSMEELLRQTSEGLHSMIFVIDNVDNTNYAQKLQPALQLAERVNYDERGAAALVRAQLSTIIEAIDSGFDNVITGNALTSLHTELRRAHVGGGMRSPLDKFVFRLCNVFVSCMETILEVHVVGDGEGDSESNVEDDEAMLEPAQIKQEVQEGEDEDEDEDEEMESPDATDTSIETESTASAVEMVVTATLDTTGNAVDSPAPAVAIVTVAHVATQAALPVSAPQFDLRFHGTISYIGENHAAYTSAADTFDAPVEVAEAAETMPQPDEDRETNLPETMDVRDNDAAPSTSGSDGASSADAENLAAAAAEVAAAHDDVENDASQANADFDQPHDSADFAAQELSEAFMHVDESYEVEQSKTVVKPRKRGRKPKRSIVAAADGENMAATAEDDAIDADQMKASCDHPYDSANFADEEMSEANTLVSDSNEVEQSKHVAIIPRKRGRKPKKKKLTAGDGGEPAEDNRPKIIKIAAEAANMDSEHGGNDEAEADTSQESEAAEQAELEAFAESREHRLDLCLESATHPGINLFDEYPRLAKDTKLIITDFCADSVKKPVHEVIGRLRRAFASCKKFEKFVEVDKIRSYLPNNQHKADLRNLQILLRYFPIERKKKTTQEDSIVKKKYCHDLNEIYNHFHGASTAEQALLALIGQGTTHPSIVSFGMDRMQLYVNMHGRLVKVDGGVPEAMLALLAVFNIFNYKFDATNTANVASVLAYFHYSIGKRLWPHPPEVLEAMRIKTGKEPQKEKEEDAKENTVNADKRGVEPLDVDSETEELGSVGYDTENEEEEASASSAIEDDAFVATEEAAEESDSASTVSAEQGSPRHELDFPVYPPNSPVRAMHVTKKNHLRPVVFVAAPASSKVDILLRKFVVDSIQPEEGPSGSPSGIVKRSPAGRVSQEVSAKRKRSAVNYAELANGNARDDSPMPIKRPYRKQSAVGLKKEGEDAATEGSKQRRTAVAPIPSRSETPTQSRCYRYEQCLASAAERNSNILKQFPQLLVNTDLVHIIGDFCAMDLKRPPAIVREQIRRAFEKCKQYEEHAELLRNDNFANSLFQADLQSLLALVLYFNKKDVEERQIKTKKRPPKDRQRFDKLYCHIDKPTPNSTLYELVNRGITQPSIVTYGNDRSILYVSIQDNLVQVTGGVQEAILALMAIYHTFNFNFDPKIKDVMTYFWYSIGKTVPKCPKEVTKILEIQHILFS
ncbi:hypothetical protein PRIPAC_85296 [Pristionchus pacificus]|uniref:Uncharacterized protein n=1 Tax=Pristionchus pacificus TaxID=54126 RepID=A0A2A6BS28_PRIPA|nr:hypothetical protein PRIPAC_85296 [Pristionchus pacificus]|eukprot:PDM68603.1 hypothetical protein PRIPAC_46905 [Pristionchus pacificus]